MNKYNNDTCENDMNFEDCELAILRQAVDENEKVQKSKAANSDTVKKMIEILEAFLTKKKLICYGGTAINNILPLDAQFYNREIEVPDYDFFSPNALDDAKELADVFYTNGYSDVEAKAGMHEGTYKVFVNFIPMADITYMHKDLFDSLAKESITIAGIRYASPNYLRMSMFLELSRPAGDVSRWEKVLKRLSLLNKYHPMKVDYNCNVVDFQRKMETNSIDSEKIYFTVRDAFIDQGVIFFGGFASSLYSKYMPHEQKRLVRKIPDFDVLSEEPDRCAIIIEERLKSAGFKNIKIVKHDHIGEIIPEHVEIKVGKETLAFIYKPIACHNYNTIEISDKKINVATIDTILSFYLAFMYANAPYYYKDRIMCMAQFLFDVEQNNRLSQRGLLKRFNPSCYGEQATKESIRALKTQKFNELKSKKNTREYEEWFLNYNPINNKKTIKSSIKNDGPASAELPIKKNKKRRKTVKKSALDFFIF